MKIGEKAKFTINSKYAYGSKGVDPVIPPNSDIILDVNVMAWLGMYLLLTLSCVYTSLNLHYFHNNKVYNIFYICCIVHTYTGNQLNPESLFQKDLDIDPFVASTPEQIQEDYDAMQVSIV